jgi:hypothetical protein
VAEGIFLAAAGDRWVLREQGDGFGLEWMEPAGFGEQGGVRLGRIDVGDPEEVRPDFFGGALLVVANFGFDVGQHMLAALAGRHGEEDGNGFGVKLLPVGIFAIDEQRLDFGAKRGLATKQRCRRASGRLIASCVQPSMRSRWAWPVGRVILL